MEGKLFTSVEEECLHWKERCLKVSQERDDAQREFDDFTAESRQLEAELEMTVEQQEKKIRDLNQVVSQLHGECEAYKRKLQYTENETSKLDTDYRVLAKENEKLKVYIRELEQKNDDLERANRVASESVVEFESMLNQAYEKNALLELEVDEKERMQIKLQRLMDEARDLKQELKVRTLKTDENGDEDEAGAEQRHGKDDTANDDDGTGATGGDTVASAQLTQVCLGANGPLGPDMKLETLNNNLNASKQRLSPLAKFGATGKLADASCFREVDSEESKTLLESSTKGTFLPATSPTSQLIIERNGNAQSTALVPLPGGGSLLNPPMASSDRVSTLNIVADLLRRLDNMEAKLKAWKIRKPSSRTGGGGGGGSGVGPGSVSSAGSHRSLHGNMQHNHSHHHSSHLQQHQQPSSYHSHHQHSAGVGGSNHSLNSLGADATTTGASTPILGNCCGSSSSGGGGGGGGVGSSGGNVQLHSYQPSTITIGTQTSQHQSALPKAEVLLGRTAK
ncbi:nuclear distribution protein nudE-like 1-A [Anopheles cruzii]|uniref:nuclear distribution protein nudE-like 1-A n=1 Tax=Anopheles cruzii TaxID=68878 RepID=UPI0022EC7FA5|nr:nuclear distribution protein nudE-like 1-A [Anopheles cruzii]